MRKRTKILVATLSLVLVIASVLGGTMVLAADPETTTTPTTTSTVTSVRDNFLNALAAKLNITVDELKSAIAEAKSETIDQMVKDRLDNLVSQGKITQEEADQYLEWWQARPDIAGLDFGWGMGFGKGFGRGMMGQGLLRGHCYQYEAPQSSSTAPSTSA